MAETLKLEIVTPEAIVYSEDVLMVTMPCVTGQIGVYPLHVPLITQVVPGEIIVHHKDGHDQSLAVGEGLVDIAANRVSIVTDMRALMASLAEVVPPDRLPALRRWERRLEESIQQSFGTAEQRREASVVDRQGLGIGRDRNAG